MGVTACDTAVAESSHRGSEQPAEARTDDLRAVVGATLGKEDVSIHTFAASTSEDLGEHRDQPIEDWCVILGSLLARIGDPGHHFTFEVATCGFVTRFLEAK